MQWWLWIVIWIVLGLGLIGTLAFFGWRLVKKGLAVVSELQLLTEKIAMLQDNVEQLEQTTPRNAILDGYSAVADRRDAHRAERARIRELRRERRLERGRLLTASQAWEGRTDVR